MKGLFKLELSLLYRCALWINIIAVLAFVVDLGYSQNYSVQLLLDVIFFVALGIGVVSTTFRYLGNPGRIRMKVFVFDVLTILFTLWIFYYYLFAGAGFQANLVLGDYFLVHLAILFTFIREVSEVRISYKRSHLNPAQLFIASFVLIVLIGTFLLMLPNATYNGISFVNALFTSTSAVCVTGLIVVDTGTYFTHFGQIIIMFLIQVGGIGILTFASYLSYFFKGKSTYENQIVLSDIAGSKKLNEVYSTFKNVILITLSIELVSALIIYLSLKSNLFNSQYDQIFFSIFHSVSAFCNAGFSTLPKGMYEDGFKFNYTLQTIIMLTFVLGGLGFPIVTNVINYLKYKIRKSLTVGGRKVMTKPWALKLNSRITLITTLSITFVGFFVFYFLEYNNTLAEHHGIGKVVTAMFGVTTPRTAGYNSIDPAAMHLPTILFIILLMWIGASPLSTGGGIKTSTFAIATLNILSLAKGKTRIEIFRREIAESSVQRAFATISLSLIIIGLGIFLISIFDPEKSILSIGFECFSAYSTVGLSLNLTPSLSAASKIILVLIMFIGRVSMLTIVIAIIRKTKHKNYHYPTEEITIN